MPVNCQSIRLAILYNPVMTDKRPLRDWLAVIFLLAASIVLLGTFFPGGKYRQETRLPTVLLVDDRIEVSKTTPINKATSKVTVISEPRKIVLEFPNRMREGENGTLRLSVETEQEPRDADVNAAGRVTDLAEKYHVLLICRLDMPGWVISPIGDVSQPLKPGQEIALEWMIEGTQAGDSQGVLWVYYQLVSKTDADIQQITLLALPVDIHTDTILGLSQPVAAWAGWLCLAAGLLLGFPMIKKLIRRSRR